MRIILTWLGFAVVMCGAPALSAQGLPAGMAGIWAEPDCVTGSRVRIINALGVIDFIHVGDILSVQMSAFESLTYSEATSTLAATVVVPSIEGTLPLEISFAGSRLDESFVKCDQPPVELRWAFGEGLSLFAAVGDAADRCATAWTSLCMMPILDFIDVTGDRKLSVAEVSRLFRAGGLFVGYAVLQQSILPVEKLGGFVAVASLVSPLLVKSLVDGMDYDQDRLLSMDELSQDRGDFAGFAAFGIAIQPFAGQTAMKAAMDALPTMLGVIFGMLR